MATQFSSISDKIKAFVGKQHIFFVASARAEGTVNLSPKGMDSLRILGPNRVIWLNNTGSGNETAIHLLENDRMTIMFCSFDKSPMILRFYGQAKTYHNDNPTFQELYKHFPDNPGARQIFDLNIDMVQTSCGFAVPYMEFQGERPTLNRFFEDKAPDEMKAYWDKKNAKSIDGADSDVFG